MGDGRRKTNEKHDGRGGAGACEDAAVFRPDGRLTRGQIKRAFAAYIVAYLWAKRKQ